MNYKELNSPLYHGTCTVFSEIDLSKSALKKDFGRGLYATNDLTQAEKFARLKATRENLNQGYVLTFKFSSIEELSVKAFESSDEEWFDFVLRNRGFGLFAKPDNGAVFDIVIGPVANDAVGVVLNNFIDGVYGSQTSPEAKDTAIRLLLTQNLHNQVFFGTQRAVDCLSLKQVSDVYLN